MADLVPQRANTQRYPQACKRFPEVWLNVSRNVPILQQMDPSHG
jgi:hypothetical protein